MTVGTGLGLRQRRYAVLLALLCIALAIESVTSRGADQFVSDAVKTLLAIAIWFVVFTRPHERVAMAALLVAGLVIRWGGYPVEASFDHALSLADQTVAAVSLERGLRDPARSIPQNSRQRRECARSRRASASEGGSLH